MSLIINLLLEVRDVISSGNGGHVPCHLKCAFLQKQFAVTGTPVSGAVVDSDSDFSCLGFYGLGARAFLSTKHHQSAIWMEDGEIAFEIIDKVKLHLCELGVVGGKVFYTILFVCKCRYVLRRYSG